VRNLLIRWAINAIALAVAIAIVPGISVSGNGWAAVIVTAAVLGLVNTFVRPIVRLLTLPITAITLGLFVIVTNGLLIWLAAWLSDEVFDVQFDVDGILPAIGAGLVVSVVSTVLDFVLPDDSSS
jgi:putative membrane protein